MFRSRFLFSISILSGLALSLEAAPGRNDYNLVPKCREADGRFRWEIVNKTSSTPAFTIQPTDNPGSTASGTALANGSGDGDAPDRTRSFTTPGASGGINWELTINGFSYRKNANTTACAAPAARVELCHIPPGNPENAHVITVGHPAYAAHMAHGDAAAPCPVIENPCTNPARMGECATRGILH